MKLYDQVKIERGIPMPEIMPKGGRRCKYPWKTMEVGESFLIPAEGRRKRENARSLVWRAGKLYNRKFAAKAVNKGLRIWRVE